MIKIIPVLTLLVLVSMPAFGIAKERPAPQVSAQDFYVYSCTRAYAEAHGFPLYDSSLAYAVEFGTLDADRMTALSEAASTYARTLPAPDLQDEEHGGVAVLALCLRQARSLSLRPLPKDPRKSASP